MASPTCPQCGADVPVGAETCPTCGRALTARTTGTRARRVTKADEFLMACDEAGLSGEHTGDSETSIQAIVINEALAGFLTMWGCRDGNLDDEVDRAQAALVTALGGMVREPGVYALAEGTPITAAAIAHLIGWVTVLDVEEPPA